MYLLRPKNIILIIVSLLWQFNAVAQENSDKDSLLSGLQLADVEVLAQRRTGSNTTSYTMGRMALDHHQMLNITGVSSLLPGGKTVNSTLVEDSRFGLRSAAGERGNASFGTAIEIDGVRLDNNGMMSETLGASTRGISSSNVESIEVITGIPSVEYGDISNGVVKVNTRHGSSPFIIEASTNPYTWQVSVNKGIRLMRHTKDGSVNLGTLNASFEHANSYKSISSPHTSYQRNVLSLAYARTLMHGANTFNIKAGLTGNIGGMNTSADPDAFTGTYTKERDNQLRGNLDFSWIYDAWRIGKLRLDAHGAFTSADKRIENYDNKSSASAQPMLHSMETGYYIAQEYSNVSLDAAGNYNGIILGPTGYWYERSFNDQKPQTWQGKIKLSLSSVLRKSKAESDAMPLHGEWTNNILLGLEYNTSRNNGRGLYYEDMQYAPSWRPYRYRDLPTMKNLALFIEDKVAFGRVQLTAGLRDDITLITGSDYGTVSSISPRVNAKYDILAGGIDHNGKAKPTLSLHAGYGKSVKLPSFQILYPREAYFDELVFSSPSTADNKAFYAYHTYASKAIRNQELRWQYSKQFDLGVEATWRGARLSVSFFHQKTMHPYQLVNTYEPISYVVSSTNAASPLASNSIYSINNETGLVIATPISGGTPVEMSQTVKKDYVGRDKYINGNPVTRYGLEWILDLPKLKFGASPKYGGATLRLDGNYYHYKAADYATIERKLIDKDAALLGYYVGTSTTSNGSVSDMCNLNATVTAHIPKVRLIVTLRFETTLLNYTSQRSFADDAVRAVYVTDKARETKQYHDCVPFNGQAEGYVAVFPKEYSVWDKDLQAIVREPFLEAYKKAYAEDEALYNQLSKLVNLSSTSYYLKPQRISAYYSANISVTKEFGKWLSVSFYANNFLNSMQTIYNSQTGLEQTIFDNHIANVSIPKFYYGLSVRLKL